VIRRDRLVAVEVRHTVSVLGVEETLVWEKDELHQAESMPPEAPLAEL
jgi:hypothetical protein